MQPVRRDEIVDYETYEDERPAFRQHVLEAKALRRFHIGPFLTFLFENRDTVRYQIQEMVRIERLVREADIVHELTTYNELIGGPGELLATLLIEIPDEEARAVRLPRWLGLNDTLYLLAPDGTKLRATWDERQVGEERLSSVQYLSFQIGAEAPVAIGCDHPNEELRGETALTDEQRAALAADLS